MTITTPGDYKLRNGDKAVVLYVSSEPHLDQPVFGYTKDDTTPSAETWCISGHYYANDDDSWTPNDLDIVAPWPKEEWRPWHMSEVRVGTIVRHKKDPNSEFMITGKTNLSVLIGPRALTTGVLYKDYEYCIETHGLFGTDQLWAPCRKPI